MRNFSSTIWSKLADGNIRWATAASLTLKVAHGVLAVLVSILLARWLGKESFGVYAFALATMSIVAVPLQYGLSVLLTREVSSHKASARWNLLRGVVRRANQLVFGLWAVVLLAAVGILYLLSARIPAEQHAAHVWAFLLLLFVALGNLRRATLQGLKRVVQGQVPELLIQPLIIILLLAVFYRAMAPSAPRAMIITCVAALIAYIVGALMLHRAMPAQAKASVPQFQTGKWLSSLGPLALIAVVSSLGGQIDVVLIGILADKSDVANYRVAFALASVVIIALSAVAAVVAPYVTHYYELGNRVRVQSLMTKATWGITGMAIPISVVFFIFGGSILELLYGVEYGTAYLPLVILCVCQLFNAATGNVAMLLNMTGHERQVLGVVSVSFGLNLIMHLLLIPRWGATGAATATAATTILMNSALCWRAWKVLGVNTTPFPFKYDERGSAQSAAVI